MVARCAARLVAAGHPPRIPRTAMLVYGIVRQAARCRFAGVYLSYGELGELVGGSPRACQYAVRRLEAAGLLRVVPQYGVQDDGSRRRLRNVLVLADNAKRPRPPRCRKPGQRKRRKAGARPVTSVAKNASQPVLSPTERRPQTRGPSAPAALVASLLAAVPLSDMMPRQVEERFRAPSGTCSRAAPRPAGSHGGAAAFCRPGEGLTALSWLEEAAGHEEAAPLDTPATRERNRVAERKRREDEGSRFARLMFSMGGLS